MASSIKKRILADEALSVSEKLQLIDFGSELAPKDQFFKYERAKLYLRAGRGNEASALLVGLLKEEPEYVPALVLLGEILAKSDEAVLGRKLCLAARQIQPTDINARECLRVLAPNL
jgi:hypothetical protein